jgi:SPP1 gp7 family putative phage head morphogenesis protein
MAVEGTDKKLNMKDKSVIIYLQGLGLKWIDETFEALAKKLIAKIQLGLSEGIDIPQIKEEVNEIFEGVDDVNAEAIARTELSRALNFATLEAYIQSDVVVAKQWITALDERTCEFCKEMEGKVLPVKKNFWNKGSNMKVTYRDNDGKMKTESMKFDYSSIPTPPLHVNCRCDTVPILRLKDGSRVKVDKEFIEAEVLKLVSKEEKKTNVKKKKQKRS